jgi:hypothetical protein
LRPGKASEKTPKGVIPPSLCEISKNASRKKKDGFPVLPSQYNFFFRHCIDS